MKFGNLLILAGALTILAGTAGFEIATFTSLRYSALGYEIPPLALLASAIGLLVWLAGCILVCRRVAGPTLFGMGVILLFLLFVGGSLLDRFAPGVTNVHIGMGGILAPVAACFLGGVMLILVGIVRLDAN